MCRTKDGRRIIVARKYRYLSGRNFFGVSPKEGHDELVFIITNDGGSLDIVVSDNKGNEVFKVNNPTTDTYKLKLEIGKRYRAIITAHGAIGAYNVSI